MSAPRHRALGSRIVSMTQSGVFAQLVTTLRSPVFGNDTDAASKDHERAPSAKICFNTTPADTAEAVRRWI
jgi:hypothetical protein